MGWLYQQVKLLSLFYIWTIQLGMDLPINYQTAKLASICMVVRILCCIETAHRSMITGTCFITSVYFLIDICTKYWKSQSTNRATQFQLNQPPMHTQRHAKILSYFTDYMRTHLCAGASNLNHLSNESAQSTMQVRLRCWKSYRQVNMHFLVFFMAIVLDTGKASHGHAVE